MSIEIKTVSGTGVPLLLDDIDTDRIIPARYLRCVTFDGLGEFAFDDDRQQDTNHPFNNPKYAEASVLVAGRNFGCGSSREHAPQSLMRWGLKAIIAESFAEIFFGNCSSLGVVAVTADRADIDRLGRAIATDADIAVSVDLETMTATAGDITANVRMPDSARGALITGEWDYLGQLLGAADQVTRHAATIPYLNNFSS